MQGVLDGGLSGCVVFACVSCCLSCVCQKVVGDNGSLCMAVLSWWRHLSGSQENNNHTQEKAKLAKLKYPGN